MKNILLLITLILFISCTNQINKLENIKKESIISNRPKTNINFKLKANNNLIVYVKSIKAYLSKSPTDPFDNFYQDNYFFSTDIINNSVSFSFPRVRIGGPYYVYLSAYDNLSNNENRKNITIEDNNLTSTEKKWSRSINSITISPEGKVNFSDNGKSLKVNLKVLLNQTGIGIFPINGNNKLTDPITVIDN